MARPVGPSPAKVIVVDEAKLPNDFVAGIRQPLFSKQEHRDRIAVMIQDVVFHRRVGVVPAEDDSVIVGREFQNLRVEPAGIVTLGPTPCAVRKGVDHIGQFIRFGAAGMQKKKKDNQERAHFVDPPCCEMEVQEHGRDRGQSCPSLRCGIFVELPR